MTPTTPTATSSTQPNPRSQATTPSLKPNEGLVTRVVDGDTIDVQVDGITYRVRYIGVDTPEPDSLYATDRKLATEATSINETLVAGKVVRLEKDVSDKDSLNRLLRYVYVGDLFVNAELVRLGYARARAYPPDVKFQNVFSTLEFEAKTARLGIWKLSLEITSVTSPVKPGADATAKAKTTPGADCTIAVIYNSGHQSTASGLVPKKADDKGVVSWTWKVSTGTNPGASKIEVKATSGNETISQTIDFIVQ
jgi:endonuclease YncB( thermonuclease family)